MTIIHQTKVASRSPWIRSLSFASFIVNTVVIVLHFSYIIQSNELTCINHYINLLCMISRLEINISSNSLILSYTTYNWISWKKLTLKEICLLSRFIPLFAVINDRGLKAVKKRGGGGGRKRRHASPRVFSCKFWEISKNTFFKITPFVATSEYIYWKRHKWQKIDRFFWIFVLAVNWATVVTSNESVCFCF